MAFGKKGGKLPAGPYAPVDPAVAPVETGDADSYVAEVRASGASKGEDYARFSDAEILSWKKHYVGNGKFKNDYGDVVDKPDERGPNTPHNRNGTGDQGDFGWGWNDSSAGGEPPAQGDGGRVPSQVPSPQVSAVYQNGTYGGAPAFVPPPDFVAPTYAEATADPGYQFSLLEGQGALERSASAKGTLRTSGTLKDLISWGQGAAAQQYGNVYDRAVNDYNLRYGAAKDKFAPQYGSWQTAYGGDLSKWSTRYGGDLAKYLNRENNIYGLLNQPPPAY